MKYELHRRAGALAMGAWLPALARITAARDPGAGVVDPGLSQPGLAGNVGGVPRRSIPISFDTAGACTTLGLGPGRAGIRIP